MIFTLSCTRLAAGFKAYHPTEHSEHATIAWSDCCTSVMIITVTDAVSDGAVEWVMMVACAAAGLFLLVLGHAYMKTGTCQRANKQTSSVSCLLCLTAEQHVYQGRMYVLFE